MPKLLWLLVALQFLHISEFMVLSPLGAMMMQRYQVGPSAFASAVAIYGLMAGVAGVLMAGFADRFNRKHTFIILTSLFLITSLGCAFAPSFSWLLFFRAASGATGGILTACAHAIVADAIPPQERGQAMAKLGMAFALASVAGVPLGILLATNLGWTAPFIAIVSAGLVALVLFIRYAPSLPSQGKRQNPLKQLWAVLSEKSHHAAFVLTGLLTMASFLVIPFIAVYFINNCGVKEQFLAYVYLVGGSAVLLAAPHIGKAADRYGKQKAFQWMAVFSIFPVLLITHLERLAPPPALLCVFASACFILGTSGRYMPALALATGASAPEYRGGFASLNNAMVHFVSAGTTFLLGLLVNPGSEAATSKIVHFNIAGYLSVGLIVLAILASKRVRAVA